MSAYDDGKSLFLAPKVSQYDGHVVMTNVSRRIKTKYVSIDTSYRDNYSSNELNPVASCVITLPERITEVKKIRVHNIEIPNSIYNVSNAIGNNCLQVVIGAASAMVVVPDGQYTAASLSAQINVSIQALPNAAFHSLVHSINTGNRSSFKNNLGSDMTLNFAIASNGFSDISRLNRKLGWSLGFRNTTYSIPAYNSTTSEAVVNVYSFKYIYLVVDEFTKGNQNSFVAVLPNSLVRKTILARIALDKTFYPFGSVFIANLTNGHLLSDHRSYTGAVDLQRLSIQLVDDVGIPVSLNGLDFSFCLEVEHE
jgi:hypothetical protein